jgi:hypothetical protein
MKKMLMLALILALASMANAATNLSWSTDSVVTVGVGESITLQLVADNNVAYNDKWVGTNDSTNIGSIITALTERNNNAGDSSTIVEQGSAGFPGWYCVMAADMTEPFDSILPGIQYDVTIQGLVVGTYSYHSDDSSGNDVDDLLSFVVVPEPATMVLLSLGGLLLRRKK